MMDDDLDHWDAAFEAHRKHNEIWDSVQFLVADVCAITGATPKAIEHFLRPDRGFVRLLGSWVNPGTGKRRMFTGGQVLMIQSAYAMNKIGFPQRFSAALAETIERRAKNRWGGLSLEPGMSIITYPMRDQDDWALQVIYDTTTEQPQLPVAVHVLDADRLIDEVHAQLQAIIAGEELPDFSIPDPVPEPNPYSPASNFFLAWEKDEQGRWLYVGLTYEETQELMRYEGSHLDGDHLEVSFERRDSDPDEADRFLELRSKHERVRQERCGQVAAERYAQMMKDT